VNYVTILAHRKEASCAPTEIFQSSGREAAVADIPKESSDFVCKERAVWLLGPL
jgi:hypothetical protein